MAAMGMTDPLEVTRIVGLLLLRHPDLAERVPVEELRRMAAQELAAVRRRPPVPAAFRRAFED